MFGISNEEMKQWKCLASILVLSMFNAMNFTMVYSFLPKLVQSFGTDETDKGYYVGIIAGMMFAGRGISSLPWGYFADKRGHKRALLFSSLCVTISTFAFGFTTSLEWTIVTRFIQGLSMGLVGICKSLIAMYCDQANMSFFMATYVSSFSFGLIVGPAIGGFLSFPGQHFPNVFPKGSLFSRFNILLPITILVSGYIISIILVCFFIPRDKVRKMEKTKEILSSANSDDDIGKNLLSDQETCENEGEIYIQIKEGDTERTEKRKDKKAKLEKPVERKQNSIVEIYSLIRKKKCWYVCLLPFLYSFIHIGCEEIFPLFAATSSKVGGLSFSPPDIGTVLLVVASICLPCQFLFIPKAFIASAILLAILFPWLPFSRALITRRILFWCALVTFLTLLRLATFTATLTINLFVNESVGQEFLGTINGLSITSSTIGRAMAPPILGSVFAASLRLIGQDTLSHASILLVFLLLSAISLFMATFVRFCFSTTKGKK